MVCDDRAREDDPRRRQRRERGVDRPWLERGREQLGVGDVRRVEHVAGERAHALGERRRARQHEVGAGREARPRRRGSGGVDAGLGGDVIDAVVDDERGFERVQQRLGLRDVGPQDRPLANPSRRVARRTSAGSRRRLSARTSR